MKKNSVLIIIIAALIIVILGIVFSSGIKKVGLIDKEIGEGKKSEESKISEEGVATEIVTTEQAGQGQIESELAISGQEALKSAKILAPNLNPISKEGIVLTPNGLPVDNSALPGSPEAPSQSMPLNKNEIPEKAIKLNISDKGFEPKEINVKTKEAIIVSLTSTDKDNVHALRFEDKSLRGARIIVSSNETRAIVFNAPEPGDYVFYCEMPHHREAGETGIMHVK